MTTGTPDAPDGDPERMRALDRARVLGFDASTGADGRIRLDNGFSTLEVPPTREGLRTLHDYLDEWQPGGRMSFLPRVF